MSRDGALDRLIGQVLAARYRILGRVGAGAMGTVFRAEHVKVGRKLAVKVLNPQMMRNEKYRRRFDREAELAGRLHHPNVASVLDVGVTPEGLRYLVMEYAEGPTLTELLRAGPMAPPRATALARRLCDGLDHAHEHDLVHRDFKPDNVIVERDQYGGEMPRILDFGIAIALSDFNGNERERLTTEGLVLGTPHYMAPEHATGQAIDHRVDLFALGVIFYEMLTGRLPFEGSGVDIARAYLSRPIPRMDARAPGVQIDPLLEALARSLLARARDERLPSARAARELLDMIERDRPAAARALGVAQEARRTVPVRGAPPPPGAPRPASGTSPPGAWTSLPTEGMLPAGSDTASTAAMVPAERPTVLGGPVTVTRGPVSAAGAAGSSGEPDAAAAEQATPAAELAAPAAELAAPAMELAAPAAELAAPAPIADEATAADPQRSITTWVEPQRLRRRAAWIAAVLVGAGICAVGVIALRGNRETAAEPTAMAPAQPAPAPAQQPALAQQPAPTPSPTPPSSGRTPPRQPTPPPTIVLRPPEVPALPAPPAPAPPALPTDDPGTQVLAQLYATVGGALKRLDAALGKEATADLWPPYLHIHIGTALGTREKRIEAHQTLRSIEQTIASRSK